MTSSRRSWQRLAEYLRGRFRVVAYDQRGHGDSAGVPGPMTLAQGVDDLQCVADALGEPIAVLIGHSWGGAVTLLASESLPVARVVAIDPMVVQASSTWYEEFAQELAAVLELEPEERAARIRKENPAWSERDVDAKLHALHAMSIEPLIRLESENPPESWDLRDAIATCRTPLLLLTAEPDESINDVSVQAYLQSHRSPAVDIRTLPGGHNLHRAAFTAFAEALESVLQGHADA